MSVAAQIATRSGEDIDVEDVAALSLGFASGAVGTFHAGYMLSMSGGGYHNAGGYDTYVGVNGALDALPTAPMVLRAASMSKALIPAGQLRRGAF